MQLLFPEPEASWCMDVGIAQPVDFAIRCASTLFSSPDILNDLSSLQPGELLPKTALPVTNSLHASWHILNQRSELQMCVSFLTGLLQLDNFSASLQQPAQITLSDQLSQAPSEPGVRTSSADAMDTATDCQPQLQITERNALAQHGSAGTMQQHENAVQDVKEILSALVLTTKLLLLIQPVLSRDAAKPRFGPLLAVISALQRRLLSVQDLAVAG